jgi:hypothetical protein
MREIKNGAHHRMIRSARWRVASMKRAFAASTVVAHERADT